jgi:hypothetical protein
MAPAGYGGLERPPGEVEIKTVRIPVSARGKEGSTRGKEGSTRGKEGSTRGKEGSARGQEGPLHASGHAPGTVIPMERPWNAPGMPLECPWNALETHLDGPRAGFAPFALQPGFWTAVSMKTQVDTDERAMPHIIRINGKTGNNGK